MADKAKEGPEQSGEEIGKLRDILSRDPRSRVFPRLAEALRKAGRLDEAVEVCRQGLEQHPGYPGGQVALARALFERGDHTEAEREISQVVKVSPDNLAAQKLMGQIELRMGNREAAEKAFGMVVMLEPRDQEARAMLDELKSSAAPVATPPVETTPSPPPEAPVIEEIEEEASYILEGPDEKVTAFPAEEAQEPPLPAAEAPEPEPSALPAEEFAEEELPSGDIPMDQIEEGEEPAAVEEFPVEDFPPEEIEEEEQILSSHPAEPVFDLSEMESMAGTAEEEEAGEADAAEEESPFEIYTKEPRDMEAPPHEARRGMEDTYEQIFGAEEIGGPEDGAEAAPTEETSFGTPPVMETEEEPGREAPVMLEEEVGELDDELSLEEMPLFDMDDEAESPVLGVGEEMELPSMAPSPEVPTEAGPPLMDFEEDFEAVEEAKEAAPQAVLPAVDDKGVFDTATLADLYIRQGFYDKAEEIYVRMLRDHPDAGELRQRLEEVRALRETAPEPAQEPAVEPPPPPGPAEEPAPAAAGVAESEEQWEWGAEAPLFEDTLSAAGEPVPEAPAPASAGEEGVIEELQRFMEMLKERRG